MNRLVRSSSAGRGWAAVVDSAYPDLRTGVGDPMRLWCVDPWDLPTKPVVGPLIYLVIGHQTVQYVGQTYRTLQERIREHLCEEPKAQDWSHVGYFALSRATSAETVDLLEHAARKAMRPQMGRRWPRPRRDRSRRHSSVRR